MKKSNLILFPLLLVLYEVAIYLTTDAYLPALPSIASDFAINYSLAQLTLTTWFVGAASMQLILGPVSDRYGRRPVLLIGGIFFIISTVACALATNIDLLLFFRLIQGATVTSMVVAGYATVHELFDHDKAIHTLAWMVGITVLAPAFGPLFGATILHFTGWRWIFWVLAIWGFIILSALFFKMPETNPNGHDHLIKIKRIIAQYKSILINHDYMRSTLSFCFLFGSIIAWISAGPFLVITNFHRSAFEFGIFQVLVFGSYIIGTRFVKPMMKKYKTEYLIKAGVTVAFLGGILSLLTWIYPNGLMLIIISLMLIAVGTGFSSPLLNRTAIEASSEPMGARMAMYSTLVSVFGVISSILISAIYNGTLVSLSAILVIFSATAFFLKAVRFS